MAATPSRYIELTQADLFSIKDWTSKQVQIVGIRLGMTRNEANSAIRKKGFQLAKEVFLPAPDTPPRLNVVPCSDDRYCEIFDSSGKSGELITVEFDKTNEVKSIAITDPDEVSHDIIPKFRGQTARLFANRYTDDLRLRLLGPESSRRPVDAKITEYIYAKQGVVLSIARAGTTKPGYELCTVSFVPPVSLK